MSVVPDRMDICAVGNIESPLGTILYATDESDRLCALCLHGPEVLRRDVALFHGEPSTWRDNASSAISQRMTSYFAGEVEAIDEIDVRACGSLFERDVWRRLRTIPPGETSTYGAIAKKIGKPGAARAVGLANGRNPAAIVVPCHRVIGSNGKLVGYGAGKGRKRWLLDHEARHSMFRLSVSHPN